MGRKQIFVRSVGCNLKCAYCDTRTNIVSRMRIETPPGTGAYEYIEGSITPEEAAGGVKSLLCDGRSYHSASLTGGEPLLLGADFINRFASETSGSGLPLHLETNGTLPEILRDTIDSFKYISMDIKIPSATGEQPQYQKNEEFLSIASSRECCVKVVFTPETPRDEIERAVKIVANANPSIPFILQPATPGGPVERYPMAVLMFSFYDLAAGLLEDVRIIPQTHRFLRLR